MVFLSVRLAFARALSRSEEISVRDYIPALRQCTSVSAGKALHAELKNKGYDRDKSVSDVLVQMYGKCNSVANSRAMFDSMQKRDTQTWNVMLAAYNQNGQHRQALQLFKQMNVTPNATTFVSVLSACSVLKLLPEGRALHSVITSRDLLSSSNIVGPALVNMYCKCGSLEDAQAVFEQMKRKTVVCWTSMISAYSHYGHPLDALKMLPKMDLEGATPDEVTFLTLIVACSAAKALAIGRRLHERVVTSGFGSRTAILNSLIAMYSKCESLEDAVRVFEQTRETRTMVSWTAMLTAYVRCGRFQQAVELFSRMNLEGVGADEITCISAVDACSGLRCARVGKNVHVCIVEAGFEANVIVGNALIAMYSRCRLLDSARLVFEQMPVRNTISWASIIGAYCAQGGYREAIELYEEMVNVASVQANENTYISVLNACSHLGDLSRGKQVHSHIISAGASEQQRGEVLAALVSMYARCGSLAESRAVFSTACLSREWSNASLWNAMVTAYTQQGEHRQALELFHRLALEGGQGSEMLYTNVAVACASLGSLRQALSLRERFLSTGMKPDVVLQTAFINMFAKCGSLAAASEVFAAMEERNLLTWNALLSALASNGLSSEALSLLRRMVLEGVNPSETTFLSALQSCNHVGLLERARSYFHTMMHDFALLPTEEQYRCMADLLGRAGMLLEAQELAVCSKHSCDNVTGWTSYLRSCSEQSA